MLKVFQLLFLCIYIYVMCLSNFAQSLNSLWVEEHNLSYQGFPPKIFFIH